MSVTFFQTASSAFNCIQETSEKLVQQFQSITGDFRKQIARLQANSNDPNLKIIDSILGNVDTASTAIQQDSSSTTKTMLNWLTKDNKNQISQEIPDKGVKFSGP